MYCCISKIKFFFFNRNIFLFIFINIYGSTMIFNSLYEMNISLVSIIHEIMYLMYQINLDLINIK